MQAIQGFLDELHHYATITSPIVSEAVAVASDLRAYLKEVTDNDLGMCSSLLFESPTSVLNFLLKTTQNKELAKTKEELLEMLLDFVKQIGPKGASTYAVSIADTCFSVFRSDQTSKVKTMCLPVIIKLVQMKISSITAESFRVQSKVETLLTELAYNKNTQTVKGNILQTLGVLAEYFPEHLVHQARTLLVMLSDLLSEQFKDKKPDYQVIDGGMRGLISLLVHFSGEVTSDPKKVATIWRFTLACLNPPEGLKTYAIPKAGLMMVEKHAELFKQYLTEKASTVYPLIKTYCTHATNRGMRKFGFSALESFLYQVACEIVSEDRSKEANMATLRFFFEAFWAGLQERNTGLLTSSVYVRGLGIFAKSIDFYMGPTEVKKMLHKLIVFSSRFYAAGENEASSAGMDAEETIEHMPSILAAYANIIIELPDVDEACIDALERIIGTFFLVFPQLYEYQRIANYKSLSRLLVALHSKGNALQTLLSRITFKGLILTCSKPISASNSGVNTSAAASPTASAGTSTTSQSSNNSSPLSNTSTEYFFEYQDLWRNIVDIHQIPGLGVEKKIYKELSTLVYKELMQASIKMLRKLDLRYSVVKESELHLPLDPAMMTAMTVDTTLTLTQTDYADSFSTFPSASQTEHSIPFSSNTASASLPSTFDSSMDIDSSSQSSQNPLSGRQSPSQARRTKAIADINKNEFLGCARTIMPGETIKPWIPKDFELFLHLVEFLKLFLPQTKPWLFAPWVFLFCKEVISKSTDFQLISGLYKLLGVALRICSQIHFFDGIGSKGLILIPKEDVEQTTEANSEKETERHTKRLCFKLITKFVRELLLRLRQYRDELLASCIQTALSIPKEFLDVQAYTPCLTRAFSMGLGFLPLTDIGLSALEVWHDEQPNELASVLPQILPVLNPYLYITKEEVESNLASNERFATTGKASSWVFGYGADKPSSGTGKDLVTTANEYRPEHSMAMQANIQVRILRFLGKLGGANAKVISDVEGQSRGVAWDSTPRVSLDLAYQSGVLNIFMDDILPSLCHLATTSSSRQTKIAACEFVHAICLNITNQDDGKGAFEQIYSKLFPLVIQLSTDVEKITRQLFEPLTSHLIKWSILTGNDKATNVLLSSLTDSLSSETDGVLRSFSASSLTHFLKLYFELKRGKQSLITLFSLLPSLACHPNPYKRLGSVMAFKQLCTVMHRHRNDPHFDHSMMQLLEIMNSMFSALHLTKLEHQSIGIEGLALQVIEQLGSLIEHFAEALFPHGLSHFVTFLFVTYCGHVRRPVRVCSQALFEKLLKLLPHNPTPTQWLKNRMTGNGAMYDVFDRALPKTPSKPRNSTGVSQSLMMSDSPGASQDSLESGIDDQNFSFKTEKQVSLSVFEAEELAKLLEKAIAQQKIGSLDGIECQRWFSGLSAWLDSLIWLLSNNIIQVGELTNPARLNPIFQHATIFLKVYAMMDLSTGYFATMTPQELEAHTQARCTTTLSVYALASILLDKGSLNLIQDVLYRSLIVSMLAPHLLGFPLYNAQDQRRIRKATTKLVSSIVRNLSNCASSNVAGQEAYNRFNTCTSGVINRAELNIANLTFTAGQIDIEKMRHIAVGIYDLNRSGILAQRYKTYLQLATHLFQQVAANHASCTPLELSALRKIIKLALVLPFEPSLLLDYLKDTSAVSAQDQSRMAVDDPSGKKRQLTKGELFYTHFKSHIDEYFIQNVEKVLGPLLTLASTSHPQLFKIVLAVLDLQLSNVRHSRIPPHKVDLAIEALSGNFFASWIAADAPFDQRDCMLEYVKKISAMNATQHIKNAKMIDFVVRTFESFMAKDQPLWFKVRVLSLLPLLLPHLPAVYIPRLIKPVEIMIIFDFPSKSSLLTPDSAAYSEYIGALDSLLSTLSTTHSIDLLEALFPLLNDNKHVHMLQIDRALETFVKGCKPENYSRLFTVCFQAFLEATPNLETLRLALIRKVCVPFMLSAKPSSLMDIMKQEATRIFGIVFPVLPEITSPKADSKPPIVDRITIITRIGAFHLIQAIFSAVSHQDRDHLNSIIFTPKDVKAGSLAQKAMRCSFAVRNKKHAEFASDVSFDVQLEYQRAAYHCLSTVLMKAQPSNIKFFEVFGFTEDVKKGDLLWEHIVDLESKFTFSVETHFPIANKQVSAIYSKASQKHVEPQYAKSSSSMVTTGAITGTMNPRRYLTSSYFVDSSLSQEAADSAFFLSPEMSPANGNGNAMEVDASDGLDLHSLDEQPSSQSASATATNAGEIELDPLNTNPCMFNMLDMIDDLNIKFGDQIAATGVMPVWMTEVFNKLERADTHINVKLFITKLIMNKPEAFENYAKDWFGPLCRVLLHNVETVGNPGFNYFVRDLCIVFLKWPKFTPQLAEHKVLAGQFMEYLMRNATHSSRRVITSNLQIIKLLVERWRDCLVDKVPRKLITDLMTLERKSTLASRFYRLVGIQLLGCIVSNKLGLWNDNNFGSGNPAMAVNRRAFMEGIVALLSYGYREVYQAAGELIGLAFLYQSPGADDTLQQMVVEKMTVMFNSEELSKFVAVLERMSRHYPVIVDTFIERLLVSLKKLGDDKVKALEIALLRIAEMNDPYAAMVSNLESLLRHRDDATQLATLNILHVIYRTIPTKDIQNLIPILTASFADHLNENVRSRYLELLMQIFDDARPELENDDSLRLGLLKGLADQNSDISGALFDFWDRDGRLPTQPSARLQQLMVKFYHPDVETHWLKMSSHLMMRLFQNHKAYEAVVSTLAHGTEGADITLDDSSAMVGIMEPSAATYVKQTLSDSQMMDSIEGTSPAKKVKDAFTKYHTLYFETINSAPPPPEKTSLRPATRPIEPTQSGFKTPTKPGTKLKSDSTEKPIPYGSPVSFMPPPKTPPRRIPSNNPSVPTSPSSSLAIFDNDIGPTGVAGEANRVRITRRFANSPIASMGSSHFFRQRELAMRKQREANARELARKRLHHVQLYRTYAGGVKTISNKDIIDPLIAVALRNDSIARLVLSILVNSMRDLIDTAMLQTTLGNLLESSHSGSLHTDASLPSSAQQAISSSISTPFINCLLRIAHDHPTLIVPSRLIADCSIKSLNFHLGIITLEKQVMKYETLLSATPAARGHGRITDSVSSPLIDDTWAQLVRLYKIIGEEDVLRGLYEKPSLTTRRDVKSALAAELEGEFEEAHARYFEILKAQSNRGVKGVAMAVDNGNDSCTENELDLCNAGQLNSLAKLSEWKQLSELVYQHLSKDPDTGMHRGPATLDEVRPIEGSKEDPLPGLWTPANREKYMKYFLDSCLMERDRWEFLFKWVDAVQDKRSSLEGEFSSQLAYLSTLRNDVGRADSYVRQAFRHFLGSWSVLPPSMATAAQLKLLQSLQPLLELEEFLNFTTNPDNFESLDATYKILELWRHRYPSQRLDDFEVWDRVGRQRAQFLNLICTHYIEYQELQKQVKQQQSTTSSSEKQPVDINFLKKVLKADRDHLFIRMAIAARKQSRLSTSDKILAGIETKLPKGRPVSFQVFFPRLKTDLVTIRHAHGLSGNTASHSIAPASTELLSSYSSLWERIDERESILSPEQLEHRSKLNLVKSSLVLDILDMQTAHPTQFSTSWKYMTSESRKPLSFVQEGTLKEVGRAAFESILESAASDSRLMAKTHFKFSRFCDKVASTQSGQVKYQYSLDAVKHMFKAIILNHQEAIGSVPLLLRILSSYRSSSSTSSKGSSSSVGSAMKQIGEQFNTLGREIPVWIWLRWLNQLIGLMDHPEFVFILPLLERVAEAYPQSLYYHFRISTDKDYGTRPVESRLRKLQHLLHNDLLDKFVYAMQQLTNPEHRAKDWMSAMNVHYQNAPLLNKLYCAFVEDCLLVTADTGDLNRQFASKISGRDVRDRGGEGMQPVDRELIQRVHKAVNEAAGTFTAISDKANTLAHYTKWLDGYTSALGMRTGEIEIPGQYGGLHKPQPEAHVKVSSFDKSLLIMTSMRRPKRLKIRGTDEKEYWFLVKGGEDLRQDQRVEQLFAICNHLFANEVETSKRNLSVHTYHVIPMTTRAGILEWIRNTAPLKAVVDAHSHNGFKTCVEEHDKFLGRTAKFKGPIQELYKTAFKSRGYDEVSQKLQRQHELLPGDLLRSKIIALSADPEAFIGIRQKAATSIAVFSVVSYIIGIGDRHLDNFLINMKDGEFIGIDFGYAFDAATLLLPIPELVPFRLTRQLTELLKPLDTDGLLKLTMVHALTALVRNRHLLLDAMDLFVNEPLLDWSMWANKLPGKPSIETYTRDRLRTVEQKLSLVDPGYITSQLLKVSIHHADEYCDNLVKIVSPKGAQGRQCASVKAQVERLIEQATNPHILGMAWAGWCPWV